MSHTFDTALDTFKKIQQGSLSAQAVVEAAFKHIEQTDSSLQAFLHLTQDLAFQTAETVDKKVASGETLPFLAGVPIALKDNIHVQGVASTCGSKILEHFTAPFPSTVTSHLTEHLLPIIGKTNMDEFAMGSSTENSAFAITKNPWDEKRVPGGSSGGSAVSVASGQVPLALGSDTGGSVRQPASLCGIAGLKPTYGLVSRYGLVAFGSSLDQISPFARNVSDLAAILQIIVGLDANDSTSVQSPEDTQYVDGLDTPIDNLTVGYITELFEADLQPDVKAAMEASVKTLEKLGATIKPISLPHLKYAVPAYYIVATAEASSNLARYDGVRYGYREETAEDIYHMFVNSRANGFGPEVKRRIMLGTFSLSSGYYDAYYNRAQKVRHLIRNEFQAAFDQCHVLLSPTSPTTAFEIGEKADDPVQMYLADIASIPANLAGIPAISIPCGFDTNNLPIGLQVLGPHFSEKRLLNVAKAFETKTGLKNLVPETLASTPTS